MAIKISNTAIELNGLCIFECGDSVAFLDCIEAASFSLTPPPALGSVSGYTSGGRTPTIVNTIDKFPFSTDTNASDVGDLTQARYDVAGQSSNENGYSSGGLAPPYTNVIDKFPFATSTNATDIGNLSQTRGGSAGQSSKVNGYTSGGYFTPVSPFVLYWKDTIDKFPFASDENATDIANLFQARTDVAGQSSSENGYTSGGDRVSPTLIGFVDTIDKFPFASDSNATDVGNLVSCRNQLAGQSSSDCGYSSGGFCSPPSAPSVYFQTIDRFPFASDTSATYVNNLSQCRTGPAGQSTSTHGYISGGLNYTPFAIVNIIEKFPFASTGTTATDVGDLTQSRQNAAGQQD